MHSLVQTLPIFTYIVDHILFSLNMHCVKSIGQVFGQNLKRSCVTQKLIRHFGCQSSNPYINIFETENSFSFLTP